MKKINDKGFTLLELILSVTITCIVLGIVFSAFIGINKSFVHRQIANEQRQLIEILEELLNDELRYVNRIKIEDRNNAPTFLNSAYSKDGKMYINGVKSLEDGIYGDNWVTLVFSKGNNDVLDVEIYIQEPRSNVETKEIISIKLLNIAFKASIEEQEGNAGRNHISYNQ